MDEATQALSPDECWEFLRSEEFGRLQDALSRHGHTATARPSEDGMRVDIVYQGRERGVPELAEALAVEVAELTRILSAREREILQTHLITEVAGTLQELIGAAERQVAAMNRELEERPTSTGMKLRLAGETGVVSSLFTSEDELGVLFEMTNEHSNLPDGVYEGEIVLETVTPIDQFLWSAHVELVSVFRR